MQRGATGWGGSLAGVATVRFTDARDGDLAGGAPGLAARRAAITDRAWVRLRMVHGATVHTASDVGDTLAGDADAVVTRCPDVAVSVATADCAPVVLASPEGVVGVAHVGWRGLLAGVVAATVDAMADLGASSLDAVVGPCICTDCYPWQRADLAVAVAAGGPAVEGRTSGGAPAFDLAGGVLAALGEAGVAAAGPLACTSCGPHLWSWRARRDSARQAAVAWLG